MHVDLHVNHQDFFCSAQKRKPIVAFELNKGLPVEILGIFSSVFERLSENCFLNTAVFHKVIQ